MYPLTVQEIVKATNGTLILGDPMMEIGNKSISSENKKWPPPGISIDSRTLSKGDLFFAIQGHRYDGHAFIRDAIYKGASVCLISELPQKLDLYLSDFPTFIQVHDTKIALQQCAKAYRKKYEKLTEIFSVNGSCGKTTVKEMIVQILSSVAPTVYSPENYNNDIGLPLSIFNLTPECRYAVFEIGSSALGEVDLLSKIIEPKLAVITNITLEHTATFGTLEEIATGESEVLFNLRPGGVAVLPRDDAFYSYLKDKVPANCTLLSFGFSKEASVYIEKYVTDSNGLKLYLVHQDERKKNLDALELNLPVFGKLNALNGCAAVAACLALNVPIYNIQKGLQAFVPPKMRFNLVPLANGATLIDDTYNSNPGSVRLSLSSFVETFSNKKKVVVLGDMLELGSISQEEHQALGDFLSDLPVEKIILFGEESKQVLKGIKGNKKNDVIYCQNRKDLLECVQNNIQSNSSILFKASRMMRFDEIIKDIQSKTIQSVSK